MEGGVKEIIGVTCIDLNIIVEISTLRDMSCWNDFWNELVTETESCTAIDLTQSELEDLRSAIAPDSVCGELHQGMPKFATAGLVTPTALALVVACVSLYP